MIPITFSSFPLTFGLKIASGHFLLNQLASYLHMLFSSCLLLHPCSLSPRPLILLIQKAKHQKFYLNHDISISSLIWISLLVWLTFPPFVAAKSRWNVHWSQFFSYSNSKVFLSLSWLLGFARWNNCMFLLFPCTVNGMGLLFGSPVMDYKKTQ